MSTSIAAVLTSGLAGALFICAAALNPEQGPLRERGLCAELLAQLSDDLRHAQLVIDQNTHSITFRVPDRDGDNVPETVRYSWSGIPGEPLTYQLNAADEVVLAAAVESFSLESLTRLLPADVIPTGPPEVLYQEFTETIGSTADTSISVSRPPSTYPGDLLIAAVCVRGPGNNVNALDPEWQLLVKQPDATEAAQFSVWWKNATPFDAEGIAFQWDEPNLAYAWVMRFTGHASEGPISQSTVAVGESKSPPSPNVQTSVPRSLVLRLAGFGAGHFSEDAPGIAEYEIVTADGVPGNSGVGGAAVVKSQPQAGWVEESLAFALTKDSPFVAITLAISPAASP